MDVISNFCNKCGSEHQYSNKYDSYYCELCNKWLEEKCSDTECDFCAIRPNKHSQEDYQHGYKNGK